MTAIPFSLRIFVADGDRDLLAIAAEFERASSCPIMALDVFCQIYCAQIAVRP
jgi:hypothetical protein